MRHELNSGAIVLPLERDSIVTEYTIVEWLDNGDIVPALIAVDRDDAVGIFAGSWIACERELLQFHNSVEGIPESSPYSIERVEILDNVQLTLYFTGENIFTMDAR